ncbi:MAG: aldehyde dehydrogenase family protein [Candidatus Aenigmarchaeota archaeon]|nr:aldehyde dehydrogenase family protein [Candidatus Aenigmarchaeota archaeon]
MAEYGMYIDGVWSGSSSGETFDVLNPATEDVIAKVPKGTVEDARRSIDAARKAFDSGIWSGKTPAERSAVLYRLAELVVSNADKLAKLESLNVGKTLKYSRDSDLPFIIDNLKFFAGAARSLEGKAAAEYSGMGTSIIRREPLGVIGCIIPWNYPLYIAVWKIAPALAAGNTLVVKPASYTPLTLLEFAKLAAKAGVPKGALNVVTGPGGVIGSEIAMSRKVDMIALTGDTETGKRVVQMASASIKRIHLELGGKAPMIVLPDADIEAVAQGAVIGGYWNTGQDCTAVTRVIIHEDLYEKTIRRMAQKARRFVVGDPLNAKTDMGPLISARQRERVEAFIRKGLEEGARIVAGGKRPAGLKKGFYLEPTILRDAEQDMAVCREEIFGPVIVAYSYSKLDEAIEKANDVDYGLAASVYGRDITSCMKAANELDFGTVWINEHGILTSEMPHGGFKQSGFGKDLSIYSFDEYTRTKHVYIDLTGKAIKDWHSVVYAGK